MSRYVSTREQKVTTREQKVSLGVGCVSRQSDSGTMNNDPSWFGGNSKNKQSSSNNSWVGGNLRQNDTIPKLVVIMNDANNVEVNQEL